MNATFRLTNPGKCDATMTLTMPMEEWRALMRQLPHEWPSWKFANAIAEMLGKGEQFFYAMGDDQEAR